MSTVTESPTTHPAYGRRSVTILPDPEGGPAVKVSPPTPRRAALLLVSWFLVLVVGTGLVLYGFGPLFQRREQHRLLGQYRVAVTQASNQASGLRGVEIPKKAPDPGSPVGILEIGRVAMQQVVVEGVASSNTRAGPGHVPGTAAPGQPGNSVIVGRAHSFGKPFSALSRLRKGNKILVTTTQGQSVYTVESVQHPSLGTGARVDKIYGPTSDDRLTLVTSSSATPWNGSDAIVVVAKMETVPFAPTPQGGRISAQTGLGGESGALAAAVLALSLYGAVMAGSVFIYRRFSLPTAYLLTIAPAAAATVICAETLSRLFPAWM